MTILSYSPYDNVAARVIRYLRGRIDRPARHLLVAGQMDSALLATMRGRVRCCCAPTWGAAWRRLRPPSSVSTKSRSRMRSRCGSGNGGRTS